MDLLFLYSSELFELLLKSQNGLMRIYDEMLFISEKMQGIGSFWEGKASEIWILGVEKEIGAVQEKIKEMWAICEMVQKAGWSVLELEKNIVHELT